MGRVSKVVCGKLIFMFSVIGACTGISYAQTTVDTVHVFFHLNDPKLNPVSKTTLDSLIYNDIITTKSNILIVGYADYLGSEKYNKGLSENRAANIRSYLVEMGLDDKKVTLCIGKGRVDRQMKSPDGFAPDRRVDLVLLDRKKQVKGGKPLLQAISKAAPAKIEPLKAEPKASLVASSLEDAEVGNTVVLNNIYFYSGRHTVRKESLPQLLNLYNFMEENPNVRIQIEGHICCVRDGNEAIDEETFELALSENRAKFIYWYLVRKGIPRWRLSYKGFGRSRPVVVVEESEEDENKNRRVEIRIVEK